MLAVRSLKQAWMCIAMLTGSRRRRAGGTPGWREADRLGIATPIPEATAPAASPAPIPSARRRVSAGAISSPLPTSASCEQNRNRRYSDVTLRDVCPALTFRNLPAGVLEAPRGCAKLSFVRSTARHEEPIMTTADHHHDHDHDDDHDRGLAFDVQTLMGRRRALMLLAGVGATALVGCSVQDGATACSHLVHD